MTSTKNIGNILLVANWESDVGYAWWLIENFWTTIANHFEPEGIDSFLVYPRITSIPESISQSKIQTVELDFSNHTITNLLDLHKLIKRHSITYVYLSDYPSRSWFYIFLKVIGVRKIVMHDHRPGEREKPSLIFKVIKTLIHRIPLYSADHFIAVSDFVNNRLIEINCISPGKCSVASNGIEPFDLENVDRLYAKNCFNIPADRLIVVTTGRATYYKGIDFIIECANDLVNIQGLNQLHFLFCGDGPDMNSFISLCKEFDLDDHFTFAGKREDIRNILPSCDIGFHASKGEVGYSLSILEYMSAGLATIVPDRESTSAATIPSKTGLLYEPESIASASDAIKRCLEPEYRKRLSRNAADEVIDRYNIRTTNKTLISILSPVFR